MRKSIIVFTLLLLLIASTGWAVVTGPRVYFSDAAMTNDTGAERVFCNNTTSALYGSTSTYRRLDGLECQGGAQVVVCEEWNGTNWVSIPCPY